MAIRGPRGGRPHEVPAIVELANSVFRADHGPSMGDEFPLLFCPENAENLRIFTDGGRPVALVGMFVRDVWMLGTRHLTCLIGAVCTDAACRGQGLATRLLEDARLHADESGVDLFLISGGRGLYRRLGYVEAGGCTNFTVTASKLPKAAGFTLRSWEEDDAPVLARIHSAEPARIARTPDEFLKLLRTGLCMDAPAGTRVVCTRLGEPVGYVTYRLPGKGGSAEGTVTVDELAGARWGILAALPELFREHALKKVVLTTLDSDAELRAAARSYGWPAERHGFHGTLGIVDPAGFWTACAPLFGERLGPEAAARLTLETEGGLAVACGDERATVGGMAELTLLAFSSADERRKLDLGLSEGSELAQALDRVFPLPLPAYGLSFT